MAPAPGSAPGRSRSAPGSCTRSAPAAVQTVEVTIDALVGQEALLFWRAVLG
jgi:hypothetical protein